MKIIKYHPLLLAFILVGFSHEMIAQNDGDYLFENSTLHEIRFESSTIPNEDLWEALSVDYTMVNMTVDGIAVDSVGVRFKGFTSGTVPQKPLKIDVNKYVPTKEFDGLKKFNLHNNFMDNFLQRERLAYELYRRAGLPSVRTSYAEVYVGGEFRGVYTIAEQIDKTFLKNNFPDNDGSLLKAMLPGVIPGTLLEVKEGTSEEFNILKDNINATNIGDYLHLRNYLKQLAVDIIIEDWDSYTYDRHNFYLYYEPKSERFNLINYDHNYAFDVNDVESMLYPVATFPTQSSMIEDPVLKVKYEQTLCELLTYLLDPEYVTSEVNHNFEVISSNNHGVVPENPAPLILYIAERKQWLQTALENMGVTCEEVFFPLENGDIVINEFVASSDSAGGVQEPDGGTPDWIELYNNTTADITLNEYYYLSDDKDFPKKWYFPEPMVIPANDYLIVWADKDVHQQGIHAGFKIEKNGGDLLMTYEDMTKIQDINYGQQSQNLAYARIPNGTGDFVVQPHTFNGNNEVPIYTHEAENSELKIYPNPANAVLWITSKQTIVRLRIYDITGKEISSVEHPQFPLNVSFLPAGMYFLQAVINDRPLSVLKLIKNR